MEKRNKKRKLQTNEHASYVNNRLTGIRWEKAKNNNKRLRQSL